jgi:hypothetical protein
LIEKSEFPIFLIEGSISHSGVISHQQAIKKAHREYEIYKEQASNRITQVEKDFIKQLERKVKDLK